MELEELDVAELGADAVGQGPPVGGGDPRIGGDRVELAHAAGRKHDRGGRNGVGRAPARQHRDPDHAVALGEQPGDLRVLHQLDQG